MTTEIEILQYLHYHPLSKRADIGSGLTSEIGERTLKRIIADCVGKGYVEVVGKGPATTYRLTPQAHLTMPLNLDTYFNKDIDERTVQESFNFDLIRGVLPAVRLFTDDELAILHDAQSKYRQHLSEMTDLEYRKEMERLGIDLSWKSSQIEGNTYSLLETERLLKEKQTANGKTKEEAVMLLNHKDALDFILDEPDYLKEISLGRIEEIHALLTKELGGVNATSVTAGSASPVQTTSHLTTSSKSGKPLKTAACLSTERAKCLKKRYWHLCSFHTYRLSPMETSAQHVS